MIDIISAGVQVVPVALALGALVVIARALGARSRRLVKQPMPVPVERDPRRR